MFYQPKTVEEALAIKAELGLGARFVAGGTDVVVQMKKGRLSLERVIDLSRLGDLTEARLEDDVCYVGALCAHRTLETWPIPVLADAARQVGGPQIRNRGTVGGNVGTASPAGDVSVALLALDASIDLMSVRGTRTLPLREFFVGVGKTAIEPDELIVGFRFRRPKASGFYKNGKRNSVAISVVCAGASVWEDGSVAIALGSVAPTPLRLTGTEAFLRERGLGAEAIAEAARLATEEVRPITDHRASADYRRAVSGIAVSRLLTQLQGGAHVALV
ncbi:xanthine dehydrogenase family protein subunit M [bacterium]|nr:xanthine dehydrogenase family protein subunit M [bacterium]